MRVSIRRVCSLRKFWRVWGHMRSSRKLWRDWGHAPPENVSVSEAPEEHFPVFLERIFYESCEFLAFNNSRFCNALLHFITFYNFIPRSLQLRPNSTGLLTKYLLYKLKNHSSALRHLLIFQSKLEISLD